MAAGSNCVGNGYSMRRVGATTSSEARELQQFMKMYGGVGNGKYRCEDWMFICNPAVTETHAELKYGGSVGPSHTCAFTNFLAISWALLKGRLARKTERKMDWL